MYKTVVKQIDGELIADNKIEQITQLPSLREAASLIQEGEVVAFPTETVYGLGADATSSRAVSKIFRAKGRPQDNPLIVHVASQAQLSSIIRGDLSDQAWKLIEACWPGPLTLILDRGELIPDQTTAGLTTVAVRMPFHPVALALIEASQTVIAAPSANSSGYPSPTSAGHVLADLQGKIPLILDGGQTRVGVESTVLDVRGEQPEILRPGGITREQLSEILGQELPTAGDSQGGSVNEEADTPVKPVKDRQKQKHTTPLSPGMKYRHYAPHTPLKLIDDQRVKRLPELLENQDLTRVALVLTRETRNRLGECPFFERVGQLVEMGSTADMSGIARNLFSLLRQLDNQQVELIIVEQIPETGLGEAVMNRLHKAARGSI
ncbi:MAG: L-threonylcarbamoyladenylate synthase [Bacillota bacterium]